MIRRPPTSIPLRQSDVDELEAFLANKRAQEDAAAAKESQPEGSSSTSNAKGKSTRASKGKGKGKAVADDSLVEAEEQQRQGKDNMTREQRIGL